MLDQVSTMQHGVRYIITSFMAFDIVFTSHVKVLVSRQIVELPRQLRNACRWNGHHARNIEVFWLQSHIETSVQ